MRNWVWVRNEGSEGLGVRDGVPVGLGCGARGWWWGLVAVPVGGGRARAGLEIDHSEPQARVWRSRGRAAAHRHTQRPGPSRQASGARNTSGATSINTRRRRLVGGPPPTGTQSDQTELGRSCAVDGGRIEQPGLTQHAAPGTPVGPHSN